MLFYCTQTKTGCFVSHMTDRIMYAGVYETAEEYHKKRLQAVRVYVHVH